MGRSIAVLALAALLSWAPGAAMAAVAGHAAQAKDSARDRAKEDGAPMSVVNLHQVDANLYRSGQPEGPNAFRFLVRNYRIRTVVSLRAVASDAPILRHEDLGLELVSWPIHTWALERASIVGALRTLRLATRRGPTLLHCEHGSDRTGLITALYRIVFQNWSKQEALDEMQNPVYGFHRVWTNIPAYIWSVDVGELRREIGLR